MTSAGPVHKAAEALSPILAKGPSRDLYVNLSKTVIWSPAGSDLRTTGPFDGYTCPMGSGADLLGAPVSRCPDFMSRVVMKQIDKCVVSLQKMIELCAPQSCLQLL